MAMCRRFPCRPLPHEVVEMPPEVRARLMIQANGDCLGDVPHLQAGAEGHEGGHAPDLPRLCGGGSPRRCTFLTDDGLCELHGRCKPFEGRVAIHAGGESTYDELQAAWDTDEGRRVVDDWQREMKP